MKDEPPTLTPLASRIEVTRRDALKLLAAGIAALEVGCLESAGERDLVPYVANPPELRPGIAVHYASALALDGFGIGIVIETHEGRPTKLDGNPAHPASLGGSPAWLQARILDLYDPQRSRQATLGGQPATRAQILAKLREPGPLTFVLPPLSSPTVQALLARLAGRRDVRVITDAPVDHRAAYRGHQMVFGRALEHQPDLSRADTVVALDSDFLGAGPMSAAWARAFAARRAPSARMNRLWVCEPMMTPTGTLADERLAVPAGEVAAVLACTADALAARGVAVPRLPAGLVAAARERLGQGAAWARRLADDLASGRRAVILVGDRQPPAVHALARVIEHALAAPVALTEPAIVVPLATETLADLRDARGAIVCVDVDPVYADPRVADVLRAAPLSVHLGLYANATTRACTAHVPLAHELETWTDPRAYDGTLAIGQPALRPRFEVASLIEMLAALLGDDAPDAHRYVQDQHRDIDWNASLRAGLVAGTRAQPVTAAPAWPAAANDEIARVLAPPVPGIEIALAPSPSLHDGRFAPNAWLQELPHPITKQTWGNAALMSAATARSLGVGDEELVRVATPAGHVELPACIVTGAADGSITIERGHGHDRPAIAAAVGTSVAPLGAGSLLRATVTKAAGRRRIVRTQLFIHEEGRELVPTTTLARLIAAPDQTAHLRGDPPSLLPTRSRTGVQWGMSIDTSICTGCSSCMVACQAENNIPTVGPDDVARGRAMHWIRIDRYETDAGVVNEPMLCQHCEDAPCEYVCPVNATDHSPDGLNEQIYNRCVGTRFCSNNCPYKVRRFNWFAYEKSDTRALQYNPDVTVRSRGVMEKCTYCVQRIRGAEHRALVEKRPIRTGEVVTACQAACPTGAIQFGELHEQGTTFAAMRRDPRRFDVLHDLGTRPRTQYLSKVKNPKEGA